MTTSLVGVAADLADAKREVGDAQRAVIDAFERGESTASAAVLETALAAAVSKREDLQDTYDYIMKKERLRGESSGKLTSVLYLSQMAPSFHPSDIPKLAFDCNAKNELIGVTGVLYVLRGWFASYIEGSSAAIERIVRKLKTDPRHTNFTVMVYTKSDASAAVRKYPDHGLKLVHVETPQTAIQQHPEATMLCELAVHAKFRNFTPVLDVVTRGRATRAHEIEAISNMPQGPQQPVKLRRYIISIAPYKHFYVAEKNVFQQLTVIEKVMKKVKLALEGESNSSQCQGAVVTPHNGRIIALLNTDAPDEAVSRAKKLYQSIRQDIETESYFPMVGVLLGDVTSIMNGTCTVVGPMIRSIRFHEIVAQELGLGLYCSEPVADELHRDGVASKGSYMYGKSPIDVYAPNDSVVHDWAQVIALAAEKAAREASTAYGNTSASGSAAASYALKTAIRKAHQPTTDEINAKPIAGLTSEASLRTLYQSLVPEADGTLLRCNLDAYLHAQDSQGVPMNSGEVVAVLDRYNNTSNATTLSFEQFCLLMYSRERE